MSRKKSKGVETHPAGESAPDTDSSSSEASNDSGAAGEVFALPAALTIHGVRELKSALLQKSDATALVVGVDNVKDVDTAGVQLLLALRRSRVQSGRALQWHGKSGVLSSATSALGLAGELALEGDA